jgi:hypothetical protein
MAMTNAAPRVCQSCGTSLSIRDRRCPNPACNAADPLDMDAEEVGTTRLMDTRDRATPYKTIAVGLGALLLVVALGYGLVRGAVSYFDTGRPDPTTLPKPTVAGAAPPPGPAGPAGPSASPAAADASPSPAAVQASPSPAGGPRLRVVNTENLGVRLRQRPSTEGQVLRSLSEGTVVEVVGPDANADGITWRNVREPGGATGWVSAEFVAPE